MPRCFPAATSAIGTFAKSLNLSGCSFVTDEAIHQVLNRCPNLQSLNLSGTATTVPFTARQQGVAAVRRYYAQLAVGSVTCTKLKAVIMGKGTAGKTSLVRALQALEAGSGATPELPEIDDRTIGVEMTLLFSTFAVHDFGGQPEYYPWHKLFLSREALYLLVADLSEGVDECVAALEEQLSILSASVPGAVVLVVLTKTDLVVAGGAEGAASSSSSSAAEEEVRRFREVNQVDVERRLIDAARRSAPRRKFPHEESNDETATSSSTPHIQFPILCASSVTQEGITAVRDRMVGAASGSSSTGSGRTAAAA